ncbi:Glyoxylate/hydroxypyruvate reductase B [Bhargavaea cecembensis DSE10]|uniref:Glyoxylate/hydroxypyruvate reductase B n=1 Tax=Bhargavaea cecembensis DSE10 TaxID=1235279 RepID=M7NIK8_9BACL|nr:D-glycerate dehydrogenase [Bhargavaea cecembensis]EMR06991.1 Glyoxylate/hydroxypyruvate reductase B [Bhargavaea cecembensis DSE10]
MKKQVMIYSAMPDGCVAELEKQFEVVTAAPGSPEFEQALPSSLGLIGSGLVVDSALLDRAPSLRIVSNISAGYDNLDIDELTNRGILATNTPDVLTETTADAIFGLLISTARRIPELDRYVKEGSWTGKIDNSLFGVDVHGKTLGMIGMGKIGQAVAERARFGFRMEILYHNRTRKPEAEAKLDAVYRDLEDLLRQSDFVCLMAPQTPETIRMIGEREFGLMKESAIFINGSRGALVDENALVEALTSGRILAAGLDVFEKEPIGISHPLLSLPNAVALPHIGSATSETRLEMARLAIQNLIEGLSGKTPPSLINSEVKASRNTTNSYE